MTATGKVRFSVDTADLNTKIDQFSRNMSKGMNNVVPGMGRILTRAGLITAAVGGITAAVTMWDDRMKKAAGTMQGLVDKSTRLAAIIGRFNASPAIQRAAERAAGQYGTLAPERLMLAGERYLDIHKGASFQALTGAFGPISMAAGAGYDPDMYAKYLGMLESMGIPQQQASGLAGRFVESVPFDVMYQLMNTRHLGAGRSPEERKMIAGGLLGGARGGLDILSRYKTRLFENLKMPGKVTPGRLEEAAAGIPGLAELVRAGMAETQGIGPSFLAERFATVMSTNEQAAGLAAVMRRRYKAGEAERSLFFRGGLERELEDIEKTRLSTGGVFERLGSLIPGATRGLVGQEDVNRAILSVMTESKKELEKIRQNTGGGPASFNAEEVGR